MANIFNKPLQLLYDGITDGIQSFTENLTKKDPHSAAFGKASEIGSIFQSGIQVSKHVKLSTSDSYRNILIIGVPSSGKSTRYIIPNILEDKYLRSMVINDPSGELHGTTSRPLSKRMPVKTVNFLNSRKSSAYNPIAHIRIMSDVYKLSDLLTRLTIDKNTSDNFWGLQARALLNCFITLLFYFPAKYRNLANLNQLIKLFSGKDPEKIDHWIVATRDNQLMIDYKSIINTPERTLQNIISSTKSITFFAEDPQIARVTSYDTLSIHTIRQRPCAIFLHNSIGNLKYANTLNSIFWDQFLNHLLHHLPGKNDYEVVNIIDEASSLLIPSLSTFCANNRKYKIINMLAIQSPHQLKSLYGEDAKDILSNCGAKIYLPGMTEMETLRELESFSGQTVFTDKKGNKTVRPLITANEIRTMHKDEALILFGNNRLIKTRTTPYFKSLKYKQYASAHPLPMRSDIPRHTIPLLH